MIRGVLVIDSAMREASASVWYGRSAWQRVVLLLKIGQRYARLYYSHVEHVEQDRCTTKRLAVVR